MDAASWMHNANGPIDLGLSPVLSHESQNSRTLNSFSEPDVAFLPPGLDLSFIGENSWQPSGHVAYQGNQCVPQEFSSGMVASPQQVPYPVASGQYGYDAQSHVVCGPQQHTMYVPDVYSPHSRRSDGDHSIVQGRPLLPRTNGLPYQSAHSNAGYNALQHGYPEPQGRVSSAHGMPREPYTSSRPASTRSAVYMEPASHSATLSPVGQMPTPRSDGIPVGVPASLAGSVNEDFSSFIQYDQDDKIPVMTHRLGSSSPCVDGSSTNEPFSHSGYGPVNSRPVLTTPELAGLPRNASASSTGPSVPTETDEGRYRNHPLYSEGPHADGLYHCPFKTDPSCQHKATKLKCNYEYDNIIASA